MSTSRCLCAWAFLLTLWTFLGVRVGQDYVPETAFDRYKRFDFSETPLGSAGLSDVSNPFLIKRIRRAIETTLGQRGYERSFKGTPDFWITYNWVTVARIELDYSSDGWFGHRYPGDSAFETTVQQYDEGTLTIDFIDPESNKLFWRGVGTRRVNRPSSPQKSSEYILKWVSAILKQYPPEAKFSRPESSGCSSPPREATPGLPQS